MILVFIDQAEGQIKKASFEAASYAYKLAAQLGKTAEAIVL
ncbi:MAG: electron transfer flavoprotein subunit alpha/FixB family protein, partial [Ferruginibacter sp.]|nr:electron transfer flavoprotein subunit alpha/FixB family protein [Ferruginibacter sp.]